MISIKTSQQIEVMREGGRILATILEELRKAVMPGITTSSIDKLARELILFHQVKPSFLDYGGFPAVVCISVNDEVVHGVPSDRELKQGDLVSLDFGIVHGGLNTDMAITIPVLGDISKEEWQSKNPELAKLINVTKQSLDIGISKIKPGKRIGEISHAIQECIESNGFGVVKDLVGHGIGEKLHEDPYVPNFGRKDDGPILKTGMTLAIEPMVTVGDWRVKQGKDGFVYKTKDGSMSAHFENTIVVTDNGAVVLTKI